MFCFTSRVVIVDTYSNSINRVEEEEDYSATIGEVDSLIAQKSNQSSRAPTTMTVTYETYGRKVRAMKGKVITFEKLFKEFSQPAVEVAVKKHELTRKTKLRVDTGI